MSEIDLSTNNVLTVDLGNSIDYTNIANKPSINSVELFGNKTSSQLGLQSELTNGYTDLTNKPKINSVELSGNKTSADLSMYTKAEVDTAISSAISGVTSFNYTVVNELPASGVKGTIYLVPNGETENKHDEYLWISEGVATPYWEKMGPKDLDISGKLDKVTTTNKLYGTDNVGGQTTYDKSDFASSSDIPTKTSDLTNDSGFLTSHQDISGKLDKVTSLGSYSRAYTLNSQGVQSVTNISHLNASGYWTIPVRDYPNKTFEVGEPVSNSNPTTKQYVDNLVATKQDTLTAGTGIDITNNVISASEEWELINSGSFSGVSMLEITKDSNNNDLSLRKFIIQIDKLENATSGGASGNNQYCIIVINSDTTAYCAYVYGANGSPESNALTSVYMSAMDNNIIKCENNMCIQKHNGNINYNKSCWVIERDNIYPINRIKFPFGSISLNGDYKLYGVRA